MDDKNDYIELVKQARLGSKESLNALAERFRGRLYAYVYRIVLDKESAQDIVQESMLQMLSVIGKLEKAERFWPWLRAIAFNRIRRAYRKGKSRRAAAERSERNGSRGCGDDGGLAKLVADELREAVVAAIKELKPEHRRVLTMRCYEEMEYSEIGKLAGCSELGARVRFCRAKRALRKRLSRKGFSKGFLVTALIVFGKLTAPSKAAAASISVTSSMTKAGVAAGLLSMVGVKTAVVSLVAAGVVGFGASVINDDAKGGRMEEILGKMQMGWTVTEATKGAQESWYYYPAGREGPVMMRVVRWESDEDESFCQLWQDGEADYYFDRRKNTIYINNWRMCRKGLAVQRLPTDEASLRDFISTVEGTSDEMEYVSGDGKGLLVVARRGGEEDDGARAVRHYNMMNEEYFKYKWPASAKVIDRRDAMHKRGWTYFRVTGDINGEKVTGRGRIPFVYAARKAQYPWMELRLGKRLRIVDSGSEVRVYKGGGEVAAKYRGGSLFEGLGRPWMGLHTIDIVRRDAAKERMWFLTEPLRGGEKVRVTLTCEEAKLVYTIDVLGDVVDRIAFSADDDVGGELRFSYLQKIVGRADEFVSPRRVSPERLPRNRFGGLWLVKLTDDNW